MTFRVGDKVMQIKNNYNIEWEVRINTGSLWTREPNLQTGISEHP